MLIAITDFASNRGHDRDTVNAYIRNHPEIQKETVKKGKRRYIDTETKAYQLLDKKYPLLKPVEVIEDTEARRQLVEAQQLIIRLQQQLVEAAPKIAWAEQNQQMIDHITSENESLKVENSKIREINEDAIETLKILYREKSQFDQKEKMWLEAKAQYNKDLDIAEKELVERREKIESLQQQLAAEQSKSWWDRLLGR
ncbi:hypothetical protein ACDL92_13175 [Ihubacter sp. mB4P-1]|uniref:hypothetical protein n=1 Tax=Ihubacter sp. mB4P-1 TaxID=3242370 RepID=UPI003C7C7ED1